MSGYRAFQDNYDTLVDGIQSPAALAGKLFSKEMITAEILDNVGNVGIKKVTRTSELLAAVRSKLMSEPASFHVFVQVIKEEPAYQDIARKMSDSYEKYNAQNMPEREHRTSVTHGSRAKGELQSLAWSATRWVYPYIAEHITCSIIYGMPRAIYLFHGYSKK